MAAITEQALREKYLELLKRSLSGTTSVDPPLMRPYVPAGDSPRHRAARIVNRALGSKGLTLAWKPAPFDPRARERGADWPSTAVTMIGRKRLDNLHTSVETVLRDGVPGDLIETGVWRGGACILMRGVLAAHGVDDRVIWAADSFRGLPPPTYAEDSGDTHHEYDALAVSQEEVEANFRRYDLLDDRVRFLAGWFADTLPSAPIDALSVVRLDGDMYGSTIDAIGALYPKLSSGGFLIVDDYGLPGCRQAITEYRDRNGIAEPIVDIDGNAVFWRRG